MKTIYLALLFVLGTRVVASEQDDAQFVLDQLTTDATIEAIRIVSARLYVNELSPLLTESAIKIIDFDAFSEKIPNSITDIAVDGLRQDMTDRILEDFTAEQLSEIVDFFHSDAWNRLNQIYEYQSKQRLSKGDRTTVFPTIKGYSEKKIRNILSSEEFQQYQSFYASDAGVVFRRKVHGLTRNLGINAQLAPFRFRNVEPELNKPYMLEIFQAEGIVVFPNRIVRKDMIAKLKASIR